jgi:hypothetical protein
MRQVYMILAAIILSGTPIFLAFIHLDSFYSGYGIDINFWTNGTEMLMLSLDEIVRITRQLVIMMLFSLAIIKFYPLFQGTIDRAKSKKSKTRNRIIGNLLLIVMGLVMWWFAFLYETRDVMEVVVGVFQALVVTGCLLLVIKGDFIKIIYENPTFELRVNVFLPLVTISLVVISAVLFAINKQYKIKADQREFKLCMDGKCITGYKFLGKTEKYYFLNNDSAKKTMVVRTEFVDSISIKSERGVLILR